MAIWHLMRLGIIKVTLIKKATTHKQIWSPAGRCRRPAIPRYPREVDRVLWSPQMLYGTPSMDPRTPQSWHCPFQNWTCRTWRWISQPFLLLKSQNNVDSKILEYTLCRTICCHWTLKEKESGGILRVSADLFSLYLSWGSLLKCFTSVRMQFKIFSVRFRFFQTENVIMNVNSRKI